MNNDIISTGNGNNGKVAAGVILLAMGSLLLLKHFNFIFIPNWLLSWPMVVIGWGIYMGAKHNFRKPSWVFLVLLGIALLITQNISHTSYIVWPAGLIVWGLWAIFKPARQNGKYTWGKDYQNEGS